MSTVTAASRDVAVSRHRVSPTATGPWLPSFFLSAVVEALAIQETTGTWPVGWMSTAPCKAWISSAGAVWRSVCCAALVRGFAAKDKLEERPKVFPSASVVVGNHTAGPGFLRCLGNVGSRVNTRRRPAFLGETGATGPGLHWSGCLNVGADTVSVGDGARACHADVAPAVVQPF